VINRDFNRHHQRFSLLSLRCLPSGLLNGDFELLSCGFLDFSNAENDSRPELAPRFWPKRAFDFIAALTLIPVIYLIASGQALCATESVPAKSTLVD
jgi:hypothetical protein